MNSLKALKVLINFFYYGFFIAALMVFYLHVFTPGGSLNSLLIDLSRTGHEDPSSPMNTINRWNLVLNVTRIILFFTILYFFRKAVMSFVVGNVFSRETRKYFSLMGMATVLLGLLKMFVKIFINYTLFPLNFTGVESTYFTIALGLLFIYISKVLEQSAILEAESKLTI